MLLKLLERISLFLKLNSFEAGLQLVLESVVHGHHTFIVQIKYIIEILCSVKFVLFANV